MNLIYFIIPIVAFSAFITLSAVQLLPKANGNDAENFRRDDV